MRFFPRRRVSDSDILQIAAEADEASAARDWDRAVQRYREGARIARGVLRERLRQGLAISLSNRAVGSAERAIKVINADVKKYERRVNRWLSGLAETPFPHGTHRSLKDPGAFERMAQKTGLDVAAAVHQIGACQKCRQALRSHGAYHTLDLPGGNKVVLCPKCGEQYRSLAKEAPKPSKEAVTLLKEARKDLQEAVRLDRNNEQIKQNLADVELALAGARGHTVGGGTAGKELAPRPAARENETEPPGAGPAGSLVDMVGLYTLITKRRGFRARAKIKSFLAVYGLLRGALVDPAGTIAALEAATGVKYQAPSSGVAESTAARRLNVVCSAVCVKCQRELSPARLYGEQTKTTRPNRCLNANCSGDEVIVTWGSTGTQASTAALEQLAAWARLEVESGFASRLQNAMKEVLQEDY